MASTTFKPPPAPPSAPPPGDGDKPKSTGMARAAGTVMLATLLSRLLGLVRDIVIAHQVGAGVDASAYVAAFKVPDLLMYLVAGGALSSTFIPVFKEYVHQNKEKRAWETFSIVATVTVVLAGAFVLFAELFTPWFVHILNPGYDQVRIDLAVPLTRIVLPAQIFFMLGGLLMGTLNARGRFLIPALGPSIYNLGIIFGAAVLYPLGMGLPGLMWGALGGAIIGNFALQIVYVARAGMRFRPSLHVFHPGAIKVWKMMGPILLGVSLPNVDQIINSLFASELSVGAQAAMQYAVRIMLIPIGVFAQAMGIAILPTMSSQAAAGHQREFKSTINKALRTILFVTVPVSVLLFLLAEPIITFLLQSGRFGHAGTVATADALRFYSLGIFAWSAQAVLTRGFYALQDSRTPVVSGTVMTVLFVIMNWLVVSETQMGVGGLGLATSVAAILHMLVMFVLLRRRLGGIQDFLLAKSLMKTVLATGALCAVAWLLREILSAALPETYPPKFQSALTLIGAGGGGIIAFCLMARLLRMSELQSTINMVRRRRKG
jgi:putative peptidoglycan lipid II flippase